MYSTSVGRDSRCWPSFFFERATDRRLPNSQTTVATWVPRKGPEWTCDKKMLAADKVGSPLPPSAWRYRIIIVIIIIFSGGGNGGWLDGSGDVWAAFGWKDFFLCFFWSVFPRHYLLDPVANFDFPPPHPLSCLGRATF